MIKFNLSCPYKVDYFNYYKSEAPFDLNNMPEPIKIEYTDLNENLEYIDVSNDNIKYVMFSSVKNENELFSDIKTIDHPYSGMWAVATASWGSSTMDQFDNTKINLSTYNTYFSKTSSIISYTKAYNSTGNIKTTPINGKTFAVNNLISQKFNLVVSASTYKDNYGRLSIEFLDNNSEVLCAIKVDKADNSFGSKLMFGSTLSTLSDIPSIGTYPSANGYLHINIDNIKYVHSNPSATTKYLDYNYNVNLTNLSFIRISELEAYQTHSSSAAGSPTGSSAYVYLQLL